MHNVSTARIGYFDRLIKYQMALSQLPVHHITSNVMPMGRSRPSRDFQSSMPQISDKAGDFSRAPSTVQTMLKNITEVGDVGQFAIKPSRFPQPTPRMIPPNNVAGQQDASRRSFSKPRYGDTQHDVSASYPTSLTSSSLVAVHLTQNQRLYRPLSRGPTNDDERSHSMSRSSYTNRSGASPRLHSSYRFQGQGDIYGSRPRSPYAYPTRLKRLGYRPSSPAYSDINRPSHLPLTGFHPESGFHTRSPMLTPKKVPSVLQPGLGFPDADFPYRSFSPGGEPHRMGAFSPSSTRVPTPGLLSGDFQPKSQSRETLMSSSIYPISDSRRSASPLPVYYDYTEAFEEKSDFNALVSLEEEQNTPQDHVKLYREVEGQVRSVNGLVETEKIKRLSYQEGTNGMERSSQPLTKVQEVALALVRRSVLKQQSSLVTPPTEEHERRVLTALDRSEHNIEKSSSRHDQSEGSIHLLAGSPSKSENGRLKAMPSHVMASSADLSPQSVSSGASMYSVQSSARPENSTFSPASVDTVKPSTFQNQPSQSSTFSRKDLNTPIEQLSSLGIILGDTSLDRWSEGEPSEIHSPTPISSPSRRRMLSRIFSIGQDSVGDSESEIAPKQVGSEQNINLRAEEITIDSDNIEAITASRLEHTSMSLPALRAAREDLGDLALQDALMKARGSSRELDIRTSMKSIDSSMETSQNQAGERTSSISTLLDARKPAARDSPGPSTQESESVNQTTKIREEEPNNLSEESALHLQTTDTFPLPSHPFFESDSSPAGPGSLSSPHTSILMSASNENDLSRTDVETLILEQKREEGEARPKPSQPRLNLKKRAEKASIESLPGSRPWNLATSYPWTDEDPKLDVTMPDTKKDSQPDDVKLPQFRFKVHRASSSTIGPMKLVKQVPPPLELFAARKTSLSSDLFSSNTFNRRPRPSVTITQYNSSHIGPSISRSAGNINSPLRTSIASPCISLVPPSPGLNLEVRSFFSDDSSQVQPKGSLRKRISQLRAMATRATSTDDMRGAERGLLSSAMGRSRTSGRSVKQDGIPSEGLYNIRHMRWRLEEKVKGWLHRSKGKVLFWGGKMGLPGPNPRTGAGVYSGI